MFQNLENEKESKDGDNCARKKNNVEYFCWQLMNDEGDLHK